MLKAVEPALKADRITGIINKVSNTEKYADVEWVMQEPIVNLAQNVVGETIKANVEFHGRAGLRAKIVRTATGKCCEWCQSIAGTYEYPTISNEVYRKHENCRCQVTYIPEKGPRQDVWQKATGANQKELSANIKKKTAELEKRK